MLFSPWIIGRLQRQQVKGPVFDQQHERDEVDG